MKEAPEYNTTAHFAVLGISYEKADAAVRGKFAFFDSHIKEFVTEIHARSLGDAFVVSTCNRTEIYTTTPNYLLVAELYCQTIGVPLSEFMQYATILKREDALMHLFRVASGLESQILGDFEIIGQIKNAYQRFKKERRYANSYLERAINSAVQVSKQIKNQTGISNGAASVSYAAVQYILTEFPDIRSRKILLVGTGEIGENTIDNLLKHIPAATLHVTNRTSAKAESICAKYNLKQIDYTALREKISDYDILIVATGAPEPIVQKDWFSDADRYCILDLSIPKNVASDVAELQSVKLIDVDTLSERIRQTMEQRRKEIPKAEMLIKERAKDFFEWEKKRKLAPQIHQFKYALKQIESVALHSIHRKYRYASVEDMELTEKIIQKITSRFAKYIIDHPMKADEISKLMHEILVEQPIKEFNEKH